MTKSFAQIIAPKITGITKSGTKFRANVQEIISLTFEHANDCGDYSALTKLVNVLGSHEKRHVIGYVVANGMNLKYDGKKQQFKKSTKKLASMTTDEQAAFAGIENVKTDLKLAA